MMEIGTLHGRLLLIEDQTGDPIFIDAADDQFPVYTAMHGEGDWESDKITLFRP